MKIYLLTFNNKFIHECLEKYYQETQLITPGILPVTYSIYHNLYFSNN